MQMQKKVSKATQKKKTQENKKQNLKQLMVTIQKASLLLCVCGLMTLPKLRASRSHPL